MAENNIFRMSGYGKSCFADLENCGEIGSIYLLPQYMEKGFGRKLIFAVIDESVKSAIRIYSYRCLKDNVRGRTFSGKCGL